MPYKDRNKLNATRRSRRRKLPLPAYLVRNNVLRTDRRNGWNGNITTEFVKNLIKSGCVYCNGQPNEVKMSLDRIDNTKPHNIDNVVASCVNCNLTRGSMPYEAWKIVADGMRKARIMGLLTGWLRRA